MRGALVLIIPTTVDVIKLEAYSQFLSRIYSKLCCKVIFAISAISTCIVSDVCDGGKRIGEMKSTYRCNKEALRLLYYTDRKSTRLNSSHL